MKTHENGINQDGSFRARRIGTQSFTLSQVYSALVTMSWRNFFNIILAAYLMLSLLFAIAYLFIDPENMKGIIAQNGIGRYWEVFLYSAQTLSTVGGIGITPIGAQNSFILTLESMAALLYMAIITGLLFVRFSRSSARMIFSESALISPYKGGLGLMIRIANAKKIEIVELKAHLFFLVFDPLTNKRNFKELELEQSHLPFSSTSWTIVHPITESSPFFKMNKEEMSNKRINIIIHISAIDSISGQTINCRQAYSKDDILTGVKFAPCSELNEEGEIVVYLDKISDYEKISAAIL